MSETEHREATVRLRLLQRPAVYQPPFLCLLVLLSARANQDHARKGFWEGSSQLLICRGELGKRVVTMLLS